VLDSLLKSFPMLAVTRINFEPDGNFPNHDPNPLDDAALLQVSSAIISEGASLGVIFDGDGDRVFFLDEAGRRIPGDATTALLTKHMLHASSGEAVVYNVPSSRVVRETIDASGGRAILCRTGHSFMKRAMREANAIFGGEHSGHYYFRDTFFAENSMLAMLLFLDAVGRAKQPVSKVVAPFMKYARSGEINFVVAQLWPVIQHALRRAYPNAAFDETDGLTIEAPEFRFNVRPSNTEPFVRLNAEAGSREELDLLVQRLSEAIKRA
jgi:phosphomannomutase